MPEWLIGVLAALGSAVGSWAAIRTELKFLWRDLDRVDTRVGKLEAGIVIPRRRWNDPRGAPRVRRDS